MSNKIIFTLAMAIFFFASKAAYAQYPTQNQRLEQRDDPRLAAFKQNIDADAKIDVGSVAKVVHHLSTAQKTQLQHEYVIIEKQKYANNLTGNPNKLDPDVLDKRLATEKEEVLKKVLTPKQMKAWNKAKSNAAIGMP